MDLTTYPVNCVSYAQAEEYCTFVGRRIPTVEQWHKAVRGTDRRVYPWGDEAPSGARPHWILSPSSAT